MLPRLYPIVDVDVCRARSLDPLAVLTAFLAGGARFLQLRDKSSPSGARLTLAEAAVHLAHASGARLIVNDRADIARLSGADGVHLGQEDLSVDEARAVLGPSAIVGLSTHDETQIAAAAATTASYIAVGPIYGTMTKATGYSPRGLELLRLAAAALGSADGASERAERSEPRDRSEPAQRRAGERVGESEGRRPSVGQMLVAIGGITLERAPYALAAGATSVAVISDLLAGDPSDRVRTYLRTLDRAPV